MTTIIKNVALNDGVTNKLEVWETCAASAFNTVLFTGNWRAAYSVDGGDTFSEIDPHAVCRLMKEEFASDQVVNLHPSAGSVRVDSSNRRRQLRPGLGLAK
jgi:hypothetical protein